MKTTLRIWCVLLLVGWGTAARASFDWTPRLADYKRMVVNVERSSEVIFEAESQGTSFATGYIVDAERGIIATNHHVVGTSPSYVKINFHDGSFTEAKPLYYDPTQDFGFYQVNPKDVAFPLEAVKLGSWRNLKVGDELLMIGNNEKEEYSIKIGTVANLNVNKGQRYGTYIHTTFDRTGGSSGSPVWNTNGEVVGIHAAGTDTSSFELPIDYLLVALKHLQDKTPIQRGEIGVDLELVSVGEAARHYGLPMAVVQEIGPSQTGGTPRVIQVERLIPNTPAAKVLRPGDILYQAQGQLLRDDLFLFDRLLDGRVDSDITLSVYRNGELQELAVPVFDLETQKIRRFARFAGGVFHDVTIPLQSLLFLDAAGVFMPLAEEGSSFSRAGYRDREGNSKVLVTELNGKPIHGLDGFIAAAKELQSGEHSYVVTQDYNLFNRSESPKSLTFNLQYGPLEVFFWNAETLEWVKE